MRIAEIEHLEYTPQRYFAVFDECHLRTDLKFLMRSAEIDDLAGSGCREPRGHRLGSSKRLATL